MVSLGDFTACPTSGKELEGQPGVAKGRSTLAGLRQQHVEGGHPKLTATAGRSLG